MQENNLQDKLNKIKSIYLFLLEKGTELKEGKHVYIKKKTAKFILPKTFPKTEEYFAAMLKDMYNDLTINAPDGVDSLGIWIELDSFTIDNAISLSTLESIEKYSNIDTEDEINVAYEFFKMTLI